MLWVTRGGRIDVVDPSASASLGFTRTVREEYLGKRVVNVDLDLTRDTWSPESAAVLEKVYRTVFDMSKTLADFEYAESKGEISIPRYFKDGARNKELFRSRGVDAAVTTETV